MQNESRRFPLGGRPQSRVRYGECSGHRRGLRPGHVLKGVARELGRAELSPCTMIGRDATRRRTGKNPGAEGRAPALQRVTNKRSDTRYRGRIATSERTREGLSAVLADHSTEGRCGMAGREGGEVRPKRPTAGKVKPGMTFYWEALQEALRGHELYHQIPVKCAEWQFPLMGSIVMRQTGCRLFG